MRQHTRLLMFASLASVALAQSGQSIVENGQSLRLDCKGGYVRVDGNRNTLTLTGRCSTLTLDGNRNRINVAVVGSIVLNGNDNIVTWNKALKGSKPVVDNSGSRNNIVHK